MVASLIAWMLGLSLISDFIERRAVHLGRGICSKRPRWIGWGTMDTGNYVGRDCRETEKLRYFMVRVPGVYWEASWIDYGDKEFSGWHQRWFYWRQPSLIEPTLKAGWSEHYIPDGEGV